MPRALITGITGQDGLYLSELLLEREYDVYGLIRGQNNPKRDLVERAVPGVRLLTGDLTDLSSLIRALNAAQPDEVYNLGAISFVAYSWENARLTSEVTGLGVLNMLEAARLYAGTDMSRVRFYQASSSEMFGATPPPQNELTPFHPRSPYGVAKVYAYWMTRNYREAYGMYAVNGILFNHESPRRGETFLTRKVSLAVGRIKAGLDKELYLGNLDAARDWGYAKEYVEGMWRMLQAPEPSDYVLATGTAYTVREFVEVAFDHVGLDWQKYVQFDERHVRPAEVDNLIGDASKAESLLGWSPRVLMHDLARLMVDADCEAAMAQAAQQSVYDERGWRARRVDRTATSATRSHHEVSDDHRRVRPVVVATP